MLELRSFRYLAGWSIFGPKSVYTLGGFEKSGDYTCRLAINRQAEKPKPAFSGLSRWTREAEGKQPTT